MLSWLCRLRRTRNKRKIVKRTCPLRQELLDARPTVHVAADFRDDLQDGVGRDPVDRSQSHSRHPVQQSPRVKAECVRIDFDFALRREQRVFPALVGKLSQKVSLTTI